MTSEPNDFKDDELISIKLPRKQYEMLKMMIKREETFSSLGSMVRSSWLWVVGGGILSLVLLWDKVHALIGVK